MSIQSGDPPFETLLAYYRRGALQEALADLPQLLQSPLLTPDFYHLAGQIFFELGQLEQARLYFQQAAELAPQRPELLNSWGIVLATLGQPAVAFAIFQKADQLQPDNPRILTNLGHCLMAQGAASAALPFYQRAIQLESDVSENWLDAGKALYQIRQLQPAIQVLLRAISLKALPEAGFWLGKAYADLGNWDEAELWLRRSVLGGYLEGIGYLSEFYRQAQAFEQAERVFLPLLEKYPAHAELCHVWVQVLMAQGDYLKAQVFLEKAAALAPDSEEIQVTAAYLPFYLGQPDKALQGLLALSEKGPVSARCWTHLGNIYTQLERLPDAEGAFLKALQLDPSHARAHANLGLLYAEQGQFEQALYHEEQALDAEPAYARAHINRAQLLLLQQKYRAGWAEYEWRHHLLPGSWPAPPWQGQDLSGLKVIVMAEQGYGDSLQFVRFIPLLAERYPQAALFLQCPPPLLPLLANVQGLRGITCDETENLSGFDLAVRLLSLPYHLQITAENLPVSPYLSLPEPQAPLPLDFTEALSSARPRVGLVWSAAANHDTQPKRSLLFGQLEPLLTNYEEVDFFSLQLGQAEQQLKQSPLQKRVINCAPILSNFGISAQILAQLDLLITVDTAAAHLAGALGYPAWVLLPFYPDWRWGPEGASSPWYPSLRLFRQSARGDWQPVLAQVQTELAHSVGK